MLEPGEVHNMNRSQHIEQKRVCSAANVRDNFVVTAREIAAAQAERTGRWSAVSRPIWRLQFVALIP